MLRRAYVEVLRNPMLQHLTLSECQYGVLRILNIVAPHLMELVVQNNYREAVQLCEIKLCTPNLTKVEFLGACYKDYSLGNLSSLVRAKIGSEGYYSFFLKGRICDSKEPSVKYFAKLLPALCSVSPLELVGYCKVSASHDG